MHGVITPTTVDAAVAKAQEPYAGKRFEIVIEKMEAERLFSFRWHPHAVDANVDYSAEPMTLVEFTLEEVKEGVMLTVTESGFDQIPLARRATAFTANDGGWGMVVGPDCEVCCRVECRPACSRRWAMRRGCVWSPGSAMAALRRLRG